MQQNKKSKKNTSRDSSHNSGKHSYVSGGKLSEHNETSKYNKSGNYPKYTGKSFSRHQNSEKDGIQADVTVRRARLARFPRP